MMTSTAQEMNGLLQEPIFSSQEMFNESWLPITPQEISISVDQWSKLATHSVMPCKLPYHASLGLPPFYLSSLGSPNSPWLETPPMSASSVKSASFTPNSLQNEHNTLFDLDTYPVYMDDLAQQLTAAPVLNFNGPLSDLLLSKDEEQPTANATVASKSPIQLFDAIPDLHAKCYSDVDVETVNPFDVFPLEEDFDRMVPLLDDVIEDDEQSSLSSLSSLSTLSSPSSQFTQELMDEADSQSQERSSQILDDQVYEKASQEQQNTQASEADLQTEPESESLAPLPASRKRVHPSGESDQEDELDEADDEEEEEDEDDKDLYVERRAARQPPRKRQNMRESKQHVCPICNRSFTRAYNLRTHVRTHDPHRQKKFGCDLCERKFDRKHDMERHMGSVHQGVRPFYCDRCHASFTRRDALVRHNEQRHEDIA